MVEESIYNLIPEAYQPPERPPMYRSKHNPVQPPSYSTFPNKASSIKHDSTGASLYGRRAVPIGHDVSQEITPKRFLHSGQGHPPLPPVQKFLRDSYSGPKPPIPSKEEKPVLGLVTDKNFVVANAVDAVVTAPKRTVLEPPRAVDRPSFGKVPDYLSRVKGDLTKERSMLEEIRQRNEQQAAEERAMFVRRLEDKDREELVASLRQRWEEKHRQYQSLPFARDTAMQKARKQHVEDEMKEIEQALAKLNKKIVYVYEDDPQIASYCRTEAIKEAQTAWARESVKKP